MNQGLKISLYIAGTAVLTTVAFFAYGSYKKAKLKGSDSPNKNLPQTKPTVVYVNVEKLGKTPVLRKSASLKAATIDDIGLMNGSALSVLDMAANKEGTFYKVNFADAAINPGTENIAWVSAKEVTV